MATNKAVEPGRDMDGGRYTDATKMDRCGQLLFFTVKQKTAVSPSDATNAGSLERIIWHVDANRTTARLRPMDRPNADGSNWGTDPKTPVGDGTATRTLFGRYLLRTKTRAESKEFEDLLRRDVERVENVYRPPLYRQIVTDDASGPAVELDDVSTMKITLDDRDRDAIRAANEDVQWGLKKCAFADVRDAMEANADMTKPIGMIDLGKHLGHPELEGRIERYVKTTFGEDSIADHAGAVAAIICARRDDPPHDGENMDGCCSAKLVVYNVWSRHDGLDLEALYLALRDAIDRQLPVVNMSIWVDQEDEALRELLDECDDNDIVVVAAIGNLGDDTELYPAAYPNVVAVVATDPIDRRHAHSNFGPHATIAAPGENIFTVNGDSAYDRASGTSYAAPFVSAAIWMAKQYRPGLTNEDIHNLLTHSVVPVKNLTCGRLDMTKMKAALDTIPLDIAARRRPAIEKAG